MPCLFFQHALLFYVQSITVLLILIVVRKLVDRFPGVLKQEEVDLLEDQYTADYLFASKKDIPPLEENIGSFWHEMLSMVDIYTQQPRFNILTK